MSTSEGLPFRTGDVLCTVFTGTLSERYGEPVERIPTGDRLLAWLGENGLAVAECSSAQLRKAHRLREAIHELGTAAVEEMPLPSSAIDTVNAAARAGNASPQMSSDGTRSWRLGAGRHGQVEDALAVIAADAIAVLSASRDRLAVCGSPTCRAVFVDASQSHTRRWCDMGTCGNRQKKARLRSRKASVSADEGASTSAVAAYHAS